jgi:hypothetical protein
MPDTERFVAAATVTVDARAHDIWALWVDVRGWSTWDDGIESATPNSNFKAGNTICLKPRGGEAVIVTIRTVTQGMEFSDEALLPFGCIRNFHRMEAVGERVKLTHEVLAEVNADATAFFAREIWPHLQDGVVTSLANIAAIVES